MKRILALFLAAGILASAAACSSGSETSSVPETGGAASGGDTGAKVTLTHLTWRVPDVGTGFDDFKKKFESEHKNITLEIQNVSSDQYYNTLQTRLLSGDPPDLITTEPEEAKYITEAKNGYLMDITNEAFLKNLIPSTLQSVKLNEKIYGIPYDTSSLVVFYNKKIFKNNGVEVPSSYNEFLNVCKELKEKGVAPISYGIKDEYVTAFLPYQIAPTAVYEKNPNWDDDLTAGKVKFNSSEWKRVFNVPFDLKQYMNDGGKNALGIGDQQSVELFASGKAAMTCTGTWATSVIRSANPNIDLGLFPFPANQDGEENWIISSPGQIMAMSATTQHPEECKEYLKCWASKDYAQQWTNSAKAISTVEGVSNDYDASMNDLNTYLDKNKTWSYPNNGWPAGVQDAFRKKLQEVWAGKGTVDDILNAMDQAAQKSLKSSK